MNHRPFIPWRQFHSELHAPDSYSAVVSTVAVAVAATSPVWIIQLFSYDQSALPFVLVPALIVANCFAIIRLTEGNQWLRRCMFAGLFLKIACASVYLWVSANVWGFSVDAYMYVNEGSKLAQQAITLRNFPLLQPFWGTNFIITITGAMEVLVGPSWASLLAIYSVIAFWGQYFVYRAYSVSLPKGNTRLAAALLFLCPSVAFWTAMVGKDALLCFGIGLIAYSVTQVAGRLSISGVVALIVGTAVCVTVRPHVAAIASVAVFVSVVFSQNVRGAIGVASRIIAIPLILAVTIYVGTKASQEWQISDFQSGIERQQFAREATEVGGSGFSQPRSVTTRYVVAPFVLFRPFLWETRSPQTALAAIEAFWLLILSWRLRKTLVATFLTARRHSLMCFATVFMIEFIAGFAPSVSNFGLLVRQRVMILPLFLCVLCAKRTRDLLPISKTRFVLGPRSIPIFKPY